MARTIVGSEWIPEGAAHSHIKLLSAGVTSSISLLAALAGPYSITLSHMQSQSSLLK